MVICTARVYMLLALPRQGWCVRQRAAAVAVRRQLAARLPVRPLWPRWSLLRRRVVILASAPGCQAAAVLHPPAPLPRATEPAAAAAVAATALAAAAGETGEACPAGTAAGATSRRRRRGPFRRVGTNTSTIMRRTLSTSTRRATGRALRCSTQLSCVMAEQLPARLVAPHGQETPRIAREAGAGVTGTRASAGMEGARGMWRCLTSAQMLCQMFTWVARPSHPTHTCGSTALPPPVVVGQAVTVVWEPAAAGAFPGELQLELRLAPRQAQPRQLQLQGPG